MLAVDYSYARPDPQALFDAGYRVVMRYLGTDGRCLTPPELRRLHAAGLMVGVIGQHPRLDRPRSGYPGGQVDASKFNAWADALGIPDDQPIFYTVDVGGGFPAESDLPVIREYFRAILDGGGRPVGQYGPYWILEACKDLVGRNGRRIVCWWETAGASGSGQGTGGSIRTGDGSTRRLSSLACMFQHVGLTGQFGDSIDHNTVHMEPVNWAWNPDITTAPKPPKQEDDEMLTIYWTEPGSTWVAEVAHLDNTISHGFRVEGAFATYIGEKARPGHEGWDPRTDAVRSILALQGLGDGKREADAPDSLMRTLCLLPDALKTATATVDIGAIVNGLRQPVTDTINAVLASRGVDVNEGALADAVAAELAERLQG